METLQIFYHINALNDPGWITVTRLWLFKSAAYNLKYHPFHNGVGCVKERKRTKFRKENIKNERFGARPDKLHNSNKKFNINRRSLAKIIPFSNLNKNDKVNIAQILESHTKYATDNYTDPITFKII